MPSELRKHFLSDADLSVSLEVSWNWANAFWIKKTLYVNGISFFGL